ncbi:MAG: hypothetical protein ACOCYO_02005 [Bacteroidota bacterium]
MKFNPFRPNSIATEELFQEGRHEVISIIAKSLFLTKNEKQLTQIKAQNRKLGKAN